MLLVVVSYKFTKIFILKLQFKKNIKFFIWQYITKMLYLQKICISTYYWRIAKKMQPYVLDSFFEWSQLVPIFFSHVYEGPNLFQLCLQEVTRVTHWLFLPNYLKFWSFVWSPILFKETDHVHVRWLPCLSFYPIPFSKLCRSRWNTALCDFIIIKRHIIWVFTRLCVTSPLYEGMDYM